MIPTNLVPRTAGKVLSVICSLCLLAFPSGPAFGQTLATQSDVQPPQLLAPDQLDTLIAPIALYPDPLLGQVLAASTYPLEVVEAQQWLQQNGNLRGADLLNAAKQQNWDPSVQALVAFPDVLTMLNRDVRWTTDLGNAFLAQQKDVMDAVQRMRVRAEQRGRLASTPQQTVTTQTEDGQSAVVIEPVDPQVIYVPAYDPEYIWGPPEWGYYPPLWYPGISFGFGFGPGIFLGGFFPGWGGWGWGGWGPGWGWGCGWFGGGLVVNNFFFNHYGFHNFYGGSRFGGGFLGGGFSARQAWQHDPFHRAGVPYANRTVASQFNNSRFTAGRANGGTFSGTRSFGGGAVGGGAVRGGTAGGSSARGFNNAGPSGTRSFAPSNRGPVGNSSAGGGSQRLNGGGSAATHGFASSNQTGAGNASAGGGWQRFNGGGSSAARGFAPSNRSGNDVGAGGSNLNRGFSSGAFNRSPNYSGQGNRGYSGSGFVGAGRSYSAPRAYGGSSPGYSAPRSFGGGSGGGRSFSSGGFSGGARSFGGGGRSFSGGGSSGGGRSFGGGGSAGGAHTSGGHGGGRR